MRSLRFTRTAPGYVPAPLVPKPLRQLTGVHPTLPSAFDFCGQTVLVGRCRAESVDVLHRRHGPLSSWVPVPGAAQ
jgi:hypothetical protein